MAYRLHLAIACLAAALGAALLIAEPAPRDPRWATPLRRPGLPNFHRVNAMLYRGGQPRREGIAELERLGIRTVICLRYDHNDEALLQGSRLTPVHLPVSASAVNLDAEAAQFLRIVCDPRHQPVFAHCHYGADRTGAMCAIYRIAVDGWSREDAIAEMTEGGYECHAIWPNLITYLRQMDVSRLRQMAGLEEPHISAPPQAPAASAQTSHGKLETIAGIKVLTLAGAPAEMGEAAGRLLGPVIRRVVEAMISKGIAADDDARRAIYQGSAIMAEYQPAAYREELRAMAKAAEVAYEDLLLLQYFGDVRRCLAGAGASALCTSFAVLPPLTRDTACIVGRNFDYFDQGVGEYASLIIHYQPQGKIPFVTLTWAGVINGWTLLNAKGLIVSNNTAVGQAEQSLAGISTCFLLRHIAENAASVEEGIEIVRRGPRACGTNLLIASGKPPAAAIIEFDHRDLIVRWAEAGFVGAANDFLAFGRAEPLAYSGRIGKAYELALANRGQVDIFTTLADAEGVPIPSMNLHCAQIDATHLRLRVAMGRIPAYRLPFSLLCLTEQGIKAAPGAQSAEPPGR